MSKQDRLRELSRRLLVEGRERDSRLVAAAVLYIEAAHELIASTPEQVIFH